MIQPVPQAKAPTQKAPAKKARLSDNAIKGIITGVLIVVVVIVVLLIYYPNIFPWNW
jgi:uncharacterized membrane protein YidH (DUF202 family)